MENGFLGEKDGYFAPENPLPETVSFWDAFSQTNFVVWKLQGLLQWFYALAIYF